MAEPFRSALLLHGAGGGGWEWNVGHGVFDAAGLLVRSPDLQPATGGLASTSFADYLQQARASAAGLPRPRAVIGASLGGLLAIACADLADALVLVNPLPPSPWHARMPGRAWPDIVPWRSQARLAGSVRALPDADPASALYAFRRWRDESGRVLGEAARGIALPPPQCPVLCLASQEDEDVPSRITRAMAAAWEADVMQLPSTSHAGPLLGRGAADAAALALAWLSAWGAASGRTAGQAGPAGSAR